jgi:hypothetical protein
MGPDEEADELKKFETAAYVDLVSDGGQPAYPIALLEDVSKNPAQYRAILLPWQEYPDKDSVRWDGVFERQLGRWQDFRSWQRENRGILDDEAEFIAFGDASNKELAMLGLTWQSAWPGQSESQYQESLQSIWKNKKRKRDANHNNLRGGRAYAGFPEYVDQVKDRLGQRGFRRPFTLLPHIKQQDRLTTWIEYLNYEYLWLEWYSRFINRLQRERDEAWERLRETGVLRAHETAEVLTTTESQTEPKAELEQAVRSAVVSAEETAKAALRETEKARHGRSSFTSQEHVKRLAVAQSRLTAAKDRLKEVERRLESITSSVRGEWPYQEAKRNLLRQELLVAWILEQVPRIAQDSDKTQDHRTSLIPLDSGYVTNRNSRKRGTTGETANDEQPFKKPRRNQPPPATEEPAALRRSARIAAKRTAVPPPTTSERPPPSARRKRGKSVPAPKTQPPKPSSKQPKSKAKRTETREVSAELSKPKRPLRRRKAG